MSPRWSFLLLALASGASAGTPPTASTPPAPVTSMHNLEGTWIYAKDPTGAVPSEPIYEGSTLTFGPGSRYTFQLAGTRVALTGVWELRGVEGDVVRIHTEYGQDRRNDLTLALRRGADGAVIGMEVREGDGSTGARFYVPLTS